MCLNHPKTTPLNHLTVEKQSSMKLIPGATKVWTCCLKGHRYLLDFYIQLNIFCFHINFSYLASVKIKSFCFLAFILLQKNLAYDLVFADLSMGPVTVKPKWQKRSLVFCIYKKWWFYVYIYVLVEDFLKVKLHLRRWSESSFSKLSYNQMVRSNVHVEESITTEL